VIGVEDLTDMVIEHGTIWRVDRTTEGTAGVPAECEVVCIIRDKQGRAFVIVQSGDEVQALLKVWFVRHYRQWVPACSVDVIADGGGTSRYEDVRQIVIREDVEGDGALKVSIWTSSDPGLAQPDAIHYAAAWEHVVVNRQGRA